MANGAKMLDVYAINENTGKERSVWRKVGVAFENRDASLNVYLDALPTNGKLNIRERAKEAEQG